jgi:hypothetical protein
MMYIAEAVVTCGTLGAYKREVELLETVLWEETLLSSVHEMLLESLL